MNTEHLSDRELQEYALEEVNCPPQFNEHIQLCKFCRQKAEFYQLMFSPAMKPAAPMFDIDIAVSVMQQLPVPKPTTAEKNYFAYWVGASTFLSAGALIYLIFMTSEGFLFGKLAPMTLGIIITALLALFAVLGVDILMKHGKQMKVLQSELQQFDYLPV